MAPTSAPQRTSSCVAVRPEQVRVGKDVIELVTSGMYVFPVTIYREYIQNAADAIDAARSRGLIPSEQPGRITLDVDHAARTVIIRDNGSGIPEHEAIPILLAIGGSPKRGTGARGFRGVGRLSGLAYCQQLEFRTKAAGQSLVLCVSWDCKLLRSRLADASFKGDVRSIISECTEVWYEPDADVGEHFFEVRLLNVARHRQDMLLNEKMVAHYLAQVAPVPFSKDFSFATVIEGALAQFAPRVAVDLRINGEPVERLYRDETKIPGGPNILTIKDIEFLQFADVDGEVGAVGWLAHHDYVRSVSPTLGVRGLRARIGDIQIGETNLLDDCFKEPRFNGWTIGEIHIRDSRIVPNGRRDNFELNHHAYNLLTQVGPVAAQIAKRCRTASVSRNSALILRNTISEVEERLARELPVSGAETSRFRASIERCRAKLKGISETEASIFQAQLTAIEAQLAAQADAGTVLHVVALDEALNLVSKHITNREQARKLSEAMRQICG